MKLSIIIPGFGNGAATAQSLAEKVRLGVPEAEVIVADGVNVAAARNEGLDRSRGEFIAWVDADDELTEGWYELMRKLAANGMDEDLLVFEHLKISERDEIPVLLPPFLADGDAVLGALLREDMGNYLWNKVLRRKFWERIRFDESLEVMEDFMILPRVVAQTRTIRLLRQPLYRYCQHSESILHRSNSDVERERIMRTALLRADEWSGSPHATDALIGAAVQSQQYLEKYLLDRREFPRFAKVAREFLRKNLLRLLASGHCSFRNRVKFAASALGWWWVPRLAWKIHRVQDN